MHLNPDRPAARVPDSLMRSSRIEYGQTTPPLPLQPKVGTLPQDLAGHLFIAAPVGCLDAPYGQGTPVFNGDGMIYRIDFGQAEVAPLHTRLARTPCYYADEATQQDPRHHKEGFTNWGFMRFSLALGLRNELNTAIVPMPGLTDGQSDRLLLTYDAGRPYEINPETLELITPVGANKEWRSAAPIDFPFAPFLSTAHPTFDTFTQTLFTVNYGRSVGNLLATIPLFNSLDRLPRQIESVLEFLANLIQKQSLVQRSASMFSQFFDRTVRPLQRWFEKVTKIEVKNFVYLIAWDGENPLERWKLVLNDGSPVKIEQSMHQVGVTQDYIVLMDTSFKVGLEQILNNPFPESEELEQLLRTLLTRPQLPDTTIYLVNRDDLKNGQHPALGEPEAKIIAKKLTLPLESIHFLVDYDNPDNQITLYISHNCATDVSEWVRDYDLSAYHEEQRLPDRLDGMLAIGQMDVNRLGRYVIDGKTGELVDSRVVHNSDYTFGVGLYTYRDRTADQSPPRQLENIYWHSWGFWEELTPKFIFDLYKDYKYRVMPIETLKNLPNEGKPVYLFRLETKSMEFADRYRFPDGYMMSSPQFIPRTNGSGRSTDGYVICMVITPDADEVWIFDGENLAAGPVCQLGHPEFQIGYSLHTAWLPTLESRTSTYNIPVEEDYQAIVRQHSASIQELFREKVYPHFRSSNS